MRTFLTITDNYLLMENRVKLQHYVPRFYLRRFSSKRGKNYLINCFHKNTSEKFLVNIRNIASEKYFYDLHRKSEQIVEKAFSRIEGEFARVYRKLIEKQNLDDLSEDEIVTMAIFIITQLIRTREQREHVRDIVTKIKEELDKRGAELVPKLEHQLNESLKDESIKKLQLQMLMDLPKYLGIILTLKWIIYLNETDMPLWTSDHPITRYNPIDLWPYGNMGLTSPGIQIHFPLTSNMAICLCDPVQYIHEPLIQTLDDENYVIFENSLQVEWSTRHVFSKHDDFSLAYQMIEEYPELKDIERDRIRVGLKPKPK